MGATISQSLHGRPTVKDFFEKRTSSVQYVVADPETKRCAILDPVLDFDPKSGATATHSADALLDHIGQEGYVFRLAEEPAPALVATPHEAKKIVLDQTLRSKRQGVNIARDFTLLEAFPPFTVKSLAPIQTERQLAVRAVLFCRLFLKGCRCLSIGLAIDEQSFE